jgi:hypothetical protein
MSKRIQGSGTTTSDKKWLTSSASALAAALTVLTASLRITQGVPGPDVNPGAKSPADPLRGNVADNNNKGHLSSVKFKFTTTTKDKVDTYIQKPASGAKPTSPSGGVSTSHGSGGHK